ncbi:Transcription factor yanR, partial [Hyphodiscus hymeniophilus]
VKCDKVRPACTQCMKGAKTCRYVDQPKFDFVVQRRSAQDGVPLSGTWSSVIDTQAEFIKISTENSKNGDPISAVAQAEEVDYNSSTTAATPSHILDDKEAALRPYVIPVGALGDHFVNELTNHFPGREVCQQFYESFLLGIHPIIPVCHLPALNQQYDDFWNTKSPSYSVESLALVLAVLYTGAANAAHVDNSNSSKILRLYEEIFCMVDFGSYQSRNVSASIQLLQGYIIMSTFKASQLAPFLAFGFLPQVIRFAQALRLHTEMNHGDEVDLEVRRRIWWHLLSLDMESTIATGLPTIIHRSSYTTSLPALCQDDAIIATQPNLSPMTVAIHGHYQWAHRMQSWFATLPSRDEVSIFKTSIERIISLIPDNELPENDWARMYLKMQIDRAYCMLGLRFWQLDQYKETGCHSEVINTVRSFLTTYLQLSTVPTMTHFSWFMPGLIQPIHAVIILLMHLSTCPNISEEEPSRYLLDHIFRLRVNHILKGSAVPAKPLLRGDSHPRRSNPRYVIMVELRKRVWKNAGWDSDGKGFDPWAGKNAMGDVDEGGGNELVPDPQPCGGDPAVSDHMSLSYDISESTGLEDLDKLLAGDPMDMFQWDELDYLASDFFAN